MVKRFAMYLPVILLICECAKQEDNLRVRQNNDVTRLPTPEVIPYEDADGEWDSLYALNRAFYDELVSCIYYGKKHVVRAVNPLSLNDTLHIYVSDVGKSLNDSLELFLGPKEVRDDAASRVEKEVEEPGMLIFRQIEGFDLYLEKGKPFAVDPFCDEFRCEKDFIEKLRSCAENKGIPLKAMRGTPYWD